MRHTPELDRQKQVIDSGEAEMVQQFYDWLHEQGIRLCTLQDAGRIEPRYMLDGRSPEQLMADYFGIDLTKIEAERRAILATLT